MRDTKNNISEAGDDPCDKLVGLVALQLLDMQEEPDAPSGFYRTPPLWGISKTGPYMHDGSSETLSDAILAHRGEATAANGAFSELSAAEQTALIAFLNDL